MFLNMLAVIQEGGTVREAAQYAAREASVSGLELFSGGDTLVVSGGVVLLIVILLIIFH